MTIYERNKLFIEKVTKMSYHPDYSPKNFANAKEKVLEMRKSVNRDTSNDFIQLLEVTQKELVSHGFEERFGNLDFYNFLENQIRELQGIYQYSI